MHDAMSLFVIISGKKKSKDTPRFSINAFFKILFISYQIKLS